LFGLLFALALTFVSSAAFGADKQYTLTVTPSPPTTATAFTFTFTNEGNSSFNSLSLSLPSGWTISTTGGATATRGTATVNPARNIVTVENINLPTGAGQFMRVTVTGVTGSSSTCGSDQTAAWSAQPWTGSSVGSGQKFNLKPGTNFPSTAVPPGCFTITATAGAGGTISPSGNVSVAAGANQSFTIAPTVTASSGYHIADVKVNGVSVGVVTSYTFNAVSANQTINATFAPNTLSFTPPTSAYVGTPFNVVVSYDGPAPSSITLAWTCTPPANSSLTNSTPSNPTTFSVTLTRPGSCTLTASAAGYFSSSANIANVYSGDLGCDDTGRKKGNLPDPSLIANYVKADSQGKYDLTRGNNKDDASCAIVPYTLDVDVLASPQTAKFVVPDPSQSGQQVAAKYTIVWGRFDVNTNLDNPFIGKRPNMSWGIASPVIGTLDYVPALPCVLDPDSPDVAGTGKLYAKGFMSVPAADLNKLMPIIPNVYPFNTFGPGNRPQFQTGQRAKMCIAQQGWTMTGTDTPGDPLAGSPATFQLWTTAIDLADGFMNVE
jgi:hypothetical protein